MRYEVLTGLSCGQLHELSARIFQRAGDVTRPGGRPAGIGLVRSVSMVVTLMRKNITQEVAGAVFRVSPAHGQPPLGPAAAADPGRGAGCVPHRARSPGRERCWQTAPCARSGTGPRSRACSPPRPDTPA